ncbi:MAG TPA: HlyD family secretion protein, partial [Gemmatimonadales bacterium]|nr:HlyD family secretion protein [Gemmatimonadales bacterium]
MTETGSIQPGTETTSRRSGIILGVAAVALLAALVWGWRSWSEWRRHVSTDNAQVDGHVMPVLARVGGYVASLRVEENQHVNAGDTLLVLDDADYRLGLARADADLLAAEASAGGRGGAGQARAAVEQASAGVSTLGARIEAARAAVTRTANDLERARALAAREIVSRQALDGAVAAAEQAAAELRALERQQEAAGSSVSAARAGVRLADARLEAARVARDDAALQLSWTTLVAPVSGTVARRQVEQGQLLQAGQPVLSIVADSGKWVTANFKETQLAGIAVGSAAEISVDAYPRSVVHGRVESIGSATGARF